MLGIIELVVGHSSSVMGENPRRYLTSLDLLRGRADDR